MLQELIPDRGANDWFFHGYRGANSDCRPAYTGSKLRSYPAHAGLTSLGCAVANDELAALVAESASNPRLRDVHARARHAEAVAAYRRRSRR